jgi:NTE family protein
LSDIINPNQPPTTSTNALVLSGGGARAAYQVGVLSAVNEILPSSTHNPFPIICGTSAGAINALSLASHTGSFNESVNDLNKLWCDLSTDQVFRTEFSALLGSIVRLVWSLFNQGVSRKKSIALLDNSPLLNFLKGHMDFSQVDQGIKSGDLRALCITAMNYTSGQSVSFYQGHESINEWSRHRRVGIRTKLDLNHLMASSAIPGIFPATKIDEHYYGDGALRQLAPISPALHMGADRIFVIGVSGNRNPAHWSDRLQPAAHPPSIAQVFGHLFSSAFIDTLEGDMEHLERINDLLLRIPEEDRYFNGHLLRPVETMVISPSKAMDEIAGRNVQHMPSSVRFLMGATGGTSKSGGASTASYLLFEKPFVNELFDLGYNDVMWERDKLEEFFQT